MNRGTVLSVAFWVSFFVASGFGAPGRFVAADQPEQPEQLRRDVEYLASEELRGRSVADDTIDVAAAYIAERMEGIGLRTDVMEGGPFQAVTISLGAEAGPAASNRLTIGGFPAGSQPIVAALGDGMNPMSVGLDSASVSGKIAFVGYGITAPRIGYDDYAGIDTTGAIVVVLRKEPQSSDPTSKFDGTRNTRHAFFATKIANAIAHGAAAVVLVNDAASVRQATVDQRNRVNSELARIETIEKQIEALPAEAVNNRETLAEKIVSINKLIESMNEQLAGVSRGVMEIGDAGRRAGNNPTVPVVSVGRDVLDELLVRRTGQTLEQTEAAIDETFSPQSKLFEALDADLVMEVKPTTRASNNVIGVLPGRGELADETVVVGAHYDHVGMGGVGSLAPGTIAVHNGADDNASGTATLLATATQMVSRLDGIEAHRRVVFIAFTGEERGLLGSKHYARYPRYPLDSTAAMVNLDMVGRLRDNELTVYGTGSADLMDTIVEGANRETQFNLFKVPSGYGPSDHQSFYEVGVPVLFFFTGLHNDYHRPSDDFDKIDFGGMDRITDITSNATFELAVRRERPQYAATENRVQIRRQMTVFMGVTLSSRGDQVALSGVTAGGPAEQAGLQVGDQIETIAGKAIQATSDVMETLRNRSPGDALKVQIVRGGQPMTVTVTLASRPTG